ncbi:MAG: single-stranded DNA-binding protein [Cyanobacteria bacterium P01_E01_bin.6]
MNQCVLMAEIVQAPQLRYTSDTQTPIAEMVVQFDPVRDTDPVESIKVVGWGNLAQEIQEGCHEGDRILIEGRLGMNSFDRPEGFKEKRAELTAQRIHIMGEGAGKSLSGLSASGTDKSTPSKTPTSAPAPAANPSSAKPPQASTPPAETNYDEIPF